MPELGDRQSVVALFKYLREISLIQRKVPTNINDGGFWNCSIDDLPRDCPFICVRTVLPRKDSDAGPLTLLEVEKPTINPCPKPDSILEQWLHNGWDDYRYNGALVKDSIVPVGEDGNPAPEPAAFEADENRIKTLESWAPLREQWVNDTHLAMTAKSLFDSLYLTRSDLERDSETLELLAVNGIIQVSDQPDIYYPVLTKRVAITFDAERNRISVVDTDAPVELSTDLLGKIEGIDHSSIRQSEQDAVNNGVHPFEDEATDLFLKIFTHRLSSDAEYYESAKPQEPERASISVIKKPMLLLRKRFDGTPRSIEAIIADIDAGGAIPEHIWEIVGRDTGNTPEECEEPSLEKALAEIGGEDPDILLPKPANREQLEIARRIEKSNAVLVQGPPGTGKTHTTANLLCHFLAQGKRVLVTSQTNKALSVLKDKVPRSVRDLCVAVLDDSNSDMEKSIDGIIEYESTHAELQLRKEISETVARREQIIKGLAQTRSKAIGLASRELREIKFQDETILPVDAARFVHDYSDELGSVISGSIVFGASIPLDSSELDELYSTNGSLPVDVERELDAGVPSLERLAKPPVFREKATRLSEARSEVQSSLDSRGWICEALDDGNSFRIKLPRGTVSVDATNNCEHASNTVRVISERMARLSEWMVNAAAASRTGADFVRPWNDLVLDLNDLFSAAGKVASAEIESPVTVENVDACEELIPILRAIEDYFRYEGRIPFIHKFNRGIKRVLEEVRVGGKQLTNADDCAKAIDFLEYLTHKKNCCNRWNQLIAAYGGPRFEDLDSIHPERVAKNWISTIEWFVSWDSTSKAKVLEALKESGIVPKYRAFEGPISDVDSVRDELEYLSSQVLPAVPICLLLQEAFRIDAEMKELYASISSSGDGELCSELMDAVSRHLPDKYENLYYNLMDTLKFSAELNKRNEYLQRLRSVAPGWALQIKERMGIHGASTPPDTIQDAWRWKQYGLALDSLSQGTQRELREESSQLSQDYRRETEILASKKAWLALLERIHGSNRMKQALNGWKLAVKQIGKGTGKNAARDKAIARSRMTDCQGAVSAWIMPLRRALESFDPKSTKFDIVIIDEASQADITALSILYLAKKVIVVGDDKQVSPMAVGADGVNIINLQQSLIKDKVGNWESYTPTTSLYDIALTTFSPLMLREHFRCVPDIIGFCNNLSYDGKIKPLRDATSAGVYPSIVSHRVVNGHRNPGRKTNEREACEIAAIIQACLERPEYDGKSFGVISMVGDEQAELIRKKLIAQLGEMVFEQRRILCGNASQFQGDERDIILLSMVDSSDGSGPLRLLSDGARGDAKKRYNVAASRARDQLWIVHSLDYKRDLKPGDLRGRLLAYAEDPSYRTRQFTRIERDSDSPFEESVAKDLVSKGYRITQQQEVGTYRIDIVVHGSSDRVALECDGDRYHSGEEKIRADMERQTILERLGWRFIRVRGSEYFRNPEASMNRICSELDALGIEALGNEEDPGNKAGSELLDFISNRVAELTESSNKRLDCFERLDAIEAGLSDGDAWKSSPSDSHLSAAEPINAVASEGIAEQASASDSSKAVVGIDQTDAASGQRGGETAGDGLSRNEETTQESCGETVKHDESSESTAQGAIEEDKPDFIVSELMAHGQRTVDQRAKGGRLWVIDQHGTRDAIRMIERVFNLKFRYSKNGSRGTRWKPSWYLLDDAKVNDVAHESSLRETGSHQNSSTAPIKPRGSFHKKKYIQAAVGKRTSLSGIEFCQVGRLGDIASVMRKIVEAESPIEKNRLFGLTRSCYGIKKTGTNIYAQCDAALRKVGEIRRTKFDGSEFIWNKGDLPENVNYFRSNNAEVGRGIEQIPPEELRSAIMYALSSTRTQASDNDLIKKTCTVLGYRRLGGSIQKKLQRVLDMMVEHGDIREIAKGMYRINR